jgi:hypothetical protein
MQQIGLPMTEMGHNRRLPHRSIGVRLCSINGVLDVLSAANAALRTRREQTLFA